MTKAGRRLFTDNEPMDMTESDGVTWGDVIAIEAEARADALNVEALTSALDTYWERRYPLDDAMRQRNRESAVELRAILAERQP
jgi:hypothetical protein